MILCQNRIRQELHQCYLDPLRNQILALFQVSSSINFWNYQTPKILNFEFALKFTLNFSNDESDSSETPQRTRDFGQLPEDQIFLSHVVPVHGTYRNRYRHTKPSSGFSMIREALERQEEKELVFIFFHFHFKEFQIF